MSLTPLMALFPKGEKDKNGNWTLETKISMVQRLLVHGNARRATEELGVPWDTYQDWRRAEWWSELIEEVKLQQRLELNNRLGTVVDKALEILEDRMENGDLVLNQKTGQIVRRAIPARDAARIANDILSRKLVMEKQDTEQQVQKDTVSETLKTLAKEFARFNNKVSKSNAETIEFRDITDAIHEEREA